MGLMSWLRGGGRTGTGTSAGTDAAAGAGSAGAALPAVPRERVDPAELPPLQRTLGAQGLVIDPSGFQGSLSTRQDTALGTPLGHLVSPDAPTGLVHGITAPAPADPAPVPRSVQRSAERPSKLPVRAVGPVPLPVPVQRAATAGAPTMTSAGGPAVADLPVRRLVGEQPLVTAVESAPDPATNPAVEPSPGTPSGPSVQRSGPPLGGDRPRRVPGLGAPLSALPPTAQRRAASDGPAGGTAGESAGESAGTVPLARGVEGDGGGGVLEAAGAPATPEPVPGPGSDAPTAPLLGDDPLLPGPQEPTSPAEPASSSASMSMPAPASPFSSSAAPAVQRLPLVPEPLAPPPATGPVVPLLADRPLALRSEPGNGVGAVQRSAVDGAPVSGASGAGPVPGPVPPPVPPSVPDAVPVRWTSAGEGLRAATVAPSPPTALQRTATPGAKTPGAPGPPLPALQRGVGEGPPVPRSLTGSKSPASSPSSFTSAGSVAVAAGVAQRAADGSVVFGTPPPAYSSPVVQRETGTEEPPPPDPPREPDPEPEPAPGPTADDHGAPGAPASGGPPGQGGREGGAPVVTDELVRALYPPLSRLFKADLRLERERAGFLINTRH
ncbi:hypothetical protein ACWCXX_07970 [Streptomyces sp. NPDC001732]